MPALSGLWSMQCMVTTAHKQRACSPPKMLRLWDKYFMVLLNDKNRDAEGTVNCVRLCVCLLLVERGWAADGQGELIILELQVLEHRWGPSPCTHHSCLCGCVCECVCVRVRVSPC